jgi:hypothetical protein
MRRDTLKLLTKKVIARRLMATTSSLIRNKPESTKDGCPKDLVVVEEVKPEKLTKKKRISLRKLENSLQKIRKISKNKKS